MNLAGVLGTQLLAWGSVLLLARRRLAAVIRVLLIELLALTVLGDLVFQTLQAFGAAVPVREPLAASTSYPDATAVVSFTAQATGATITAVAGVGLLVVAFDLVALAAVAVVVLRRRRIRSD